MTTNHYEQRRPASDRELRPGLADDVLRGLCVRGNFADVRIARRCRIRGGAL